MNRPGWPGIGRTLWSGGAGMSVGGVGRGRRITGGRGSVGGAAGLPAVCAVALAEQKASKASRRWTAMSGAFPRSGTPFFIADPDASR